MSRSGYLYDLSNWDLIRWRGQVTSSIKGQRGQRLLKDLAEAMDSMSNKRLITDELKTVGGEYCALGTVGLRRGLDMDNIDPHNYEIVAEKFDITAQLAQEIVYQNDEVGYNETPEQRWQRIRDWVNKKLIKKEIL